MMHVRKSVHILRCFKILFLSLAPCRVLTEIGHDTLDLYGKVVPETTLEIHILPYRYCRPYHIVFYL